MPKILSDKDVSQLVKDRKLGLGMLRELPRDDDGEVDQEKALVNALTNLSSTNKELVSALTSMADLNREQGDILARCLRNLVEAVKSVGSSPVQISEPAVRDWEFIVERDRRNLITNIYARRTGATSQGN